MLGVLGQTYTNNGGGTGAGLAIFYLILYVLYVAGLWGIFTKAGEEGWKAIIPIYNMIILLKIAGRPWWWILLLLIPIVNIVILILWYSSLSKSFGKGTGFTVGLFFLNFIFLLILGFGSATYIGPNAASAAPAGSIPPPPPPPSMPSA